MAGIYFELVTTLLNARSFFIFLIFAADAYIFMRAIAFYFQRSDGIKKYFLEKSARFPKISKIMRDVFSSISLASPEGKSLSRENSLNAKSD